MDLDISPAVYTAYKGPFRLRTVGKTAMKTIESLREKLSALAEEGVGAAGALHSPKYYDDDRWVSAQSSIMFMPLPGRTLWSGPSRGYDGNLRDLLISLAQVITRRRGKKINEYESEEGGYEAGVLVTPGAVFETGRTFYGNPSITGIVVSDKSRSSDLGALSCSRDVETSLRGMAAFLPSNSGAFVWPQDPSTLSAHQIMIREELLFTPPILDLLGERLDGPRRHPLALERFAVPGRPDIILFSTPNKIGKIDGVDIWHKRDVLAAFFF